MFVAAAARVLFTALHEQFVNQWLDFLKHRLNKTHGRICKQMAIKRDALMRSPKPLVTLA